MYGKRDIVDMHCDTIAGIEAARRVKGMLDCCLAENIGHVDVKRMRESGYLLQNFALFVNMGTCDEPWEQWKRLIKVYEEELTANNAWLAPVFFFGDIEKNRKAGKMSSLLTVEEGGICGGKMERLHEFFEKGVRMVTLTWNYPNELGYPNLDTERGKAAKKDAESALRYLNTPDEKNGLTNRGQEFVEEMERLGMIPDVSHLSDAGFWDVLRVARKPFVASHSNARSICPCVRNLSDEMIRGLAEKGGCMGLNFCADFLAQKPAGETYGGTIEDIVRHAQHIINVGGVEVLGLGSDFDGIPTHEELQGAQGMERLADALSKSGLHEAEVDKVFSGNVLRVYKDCLPS